MASESITHLKFFVDEGKRQVALFSSDNENEVWLRNAPAESVLNSDWKELQRQCVPVEALLSVGDVKLQGLLRNEFLESEEPSQLKVIEAWTMRKAGMATRLADEATASGDRAGDAEHSQRVVNCLEEVLASCKDEQQLKEISQLRLSFLLRAVSCRLELWNELQKPGEAEALTRLFAALTDPKWPNDGIDQIAAQSNTAFWRNQALRAWGEASKSAEAEGAIDEAEHCCTKVLRILQDQDLSV